MLTLGWSDGNSFLGIDFALLSSAKEKNRYTEVRSDIDQRTSGYQRRTEALTKATELSRPGGHQRLPLEFQQNMS